MRGAHSSLAEGTAAPSARAAVEASYAAIKGDEFVEPTIIGAPHPMADGDQVICYNFRADRARELTTALTQADFTGFARPRIPQVGYVCMTEYERSLQSAAGLRARRRARPARRGARARGHPQPAHRRDREVCPRHLLPQRWRRAAIRARGARADSVIQGRDLRSRARDAGGRDREARGRGDRERPFRRGSDELREPRHGRPYRQHERHGQGGRDFRRRAGHRHRCAHTASAASR